MGLLDGKLALVSGVANARSIGWGIAQALHAQGARLAFTCVGPSRKRVVKLAAQVESDLVFPCDVSSDEEIVRAFAQVGQVFDGQLHVFVHSIAYARLEEMGGEFLRVTRDGWRLALETSAYSLVAMSRAARPLMKAAGGGAILTLSYVGGVQVAPSYNIMGVAKAALESSVRYLAYDLGPDNIRVNALSPGPIPTVSSMVIDGFEESVRSTACQTPMLRCPTVEDVGNAAVFYAADVSRMITGSTVYIDGGMNFLIAGAGAHPRASQAEAIAVKNPEVQDV
jgi:enoyl-[acyl-carrier protein] reductase I